MASHHRRLSTAIVTTMILEAINKISPLIVIHHAQKKLGLPDFGWAQSMMAFCEILQPMVTYGYMNYGMTQAGPWEATQTGGAAPSSFAGPSHPLARLFSHILVLKSFHALAIALMLLTSFWLSAERGSANTAAFFLDPATLTSASLILMVLVASTLDGYWVLVVKGRLTRLTLCAGMLRLFSLMTIVTGVATPEDRGLFVFLSLMPNTLIACATGFLILKSHPPTAIARQELFHIFRQSTPFALVFLGSTLADRIDLMFVQHFLGYEAAGVYAGPAKLVQSIALMIGSLSIPFFAETIKTRDPKILSHHLAMSLWFLMTFLSPMLVGSPFVERALLDFVLTDLPTAADGLLSTLAWGVLGSVLLFTFGHQILISQARPWETFWALTLGLTATATSVGTLHYFGSLSEGAVALSAVGGRLLTGVFCVIWSRSRLDRLPWSSMIKPLLAAVLMGLCIEFLKPKSFISTLLVGGMSYCLFFIVINRKEIRGLMRHPWFSRFVHFRR